MEIDMYKNQMLSGKNEIQNIIIKSPKNIQKCRRPEYRWLLSNLSPNICNVDISCDTLIGGDCEKGDYQLWLFSIEHWNPQYKIFHNDKQTKEDEKICSRNKIYHRQLTNNQALVIDLQFLIDALDIRTDAAFTCKVAYDCNIQSVDKLATKGMPSKTASTLFITKNNGILLRVTGSDNLSYSSLTSTTTSKVKTTTTNIDTIKSKKVLNILK